MRGEQLARQWRILRTIEASRQGLTVAELADAEGISVRTAYRDLEALQDAGFPLYPEKVERAKRWAFVDTFTFQVPQPFTMTELMALHLYCDFIRMFQGTAFYDSLESLFKKVKATLPPEPLAYLDRVQNAFSVGIRPYKEYGRFREILNQVSQAVTDSRTVEMAYRGLKSKSEAVRRVDPYKIWLLDGTIYLIGYCHVRREVRVFVLDRISMLTVTDQAFEFPQDFDLDAFMGSSFRVMRGEPRSVKIRISPEWSRWVGEKTWHESQKTRKLEDGSLEIAFRVAGLDEIRQWVLSLGPEATVLEPPELRELVRVSLHATLAHYEERAPVEEPASRAVPPRGSA